MEKKQVQATAGDSEGRYTKRNGAEKKAGVGSEENPAKNGAKGKAAAKEANKRQSTGGNTNGRQTNRNCVEKKSGVAPE